MFRTYITDEGNNVLDENASLKMYVAYLSEVITRQVINCKENVHKLTCISNALLYKQQTTIQKQ